MKKLLLIILIMEMCFMFGCTKNEFGKIKIGESMAAAKEVYGSSYTDLNTINVFKDKNSYVVIVSDFRKITGIVVFDSTGKLLSSKGVTPINDESIKQFYGKSVDDLEKRFGKIHCDTGSGFYIPAHITDHATIILMYVEGNIVVNISSTDIINDSTVDLSPTEWH